MGAYELYLKTRICKECFVAITEPHPDELMAEKGWVKCPICGWCTEITANARKEKLTHKP